MINRREMLASLAGAVAGTLPGRLPGAAASSQKQADRPNVLWITCEDMGPHLGCYGDDYSDSPNLDRLAAKGMLYQYAWSNAPVCAPARSTIISGLYPPSIGSQHMRSSTHLPDGMLMYPCYLREAGYYCTNNSKQDYNLQRTGKVWDESSRKAHWKNRADGQPFFAIFNITTTHESQIRRRPHKAVHDPAKVRVPAYHPDTPEVRQDWAQYYDKIAEMDAQAGRRLDELEEAGLADDTIVIFYSDHGSGMPRSKRWPYNSGLHVAMMVYVPEKFRHLAPKEYKPGGKSDRPVAFIDLPPTLLSTVGLEPPKHMQGHAFMGKYETEPQPYIYGFRGRMDERYDMVRSVRDQRYIYIRNYMPHKIYGQHVSYMFQTPTTQVWKRLYDEEKLNAAQSHFWETKPPEELYDLENDPDEVNNLADSPNHREILERMRKAQRDWAVRIRDVGFLPEAEIHTRSGDDAPCVMGHDPSRYPMKKIIAAAERASSLDKGALPALKKALKDEDSAVRYWGAQGILMRGEQAVAASKEDLDAALADAAQPVQVIAAETLCRHGSKADLDKALPVLVDVALNDRTGGYTALLAVNAIDILDDKAAGAIEEIKKIPDRAKKYPGQPRGYVMRVYEKIMADLGG
jgi:uncharacterized sulfatase